jgi:CRP/FNR family transcriptional regulator
MPLADVASEQHVACGDVFIAAGDLAMGVQILLSGTVRVFHKSLAGAEVTVKHLQAPCTLGEMQCLAGQERFQENAAALTDCQLLFIPKRAFETFLQGNPDVTLALLKDISARFCVAARNERAPLCSVPQRLASLLLSYAEVFGQKSHDGIKVRFATTQGDMAQGIAADVRSVQRALQDWQQSQVVTRRQGWWVIRDPGSLFREAGELRANLNYRMRA